MLLLFYFPIILVSFIFQANLAPAASTKPQFCLQKNNSAITKRFNNFLWRIKRQPPSYFFGTIHVPYTDVWEYVSNAAKQAFHQADNVFLELDLNNPKTVQSLSRCQYLPDGETIADHLPTSLYNRIKAHMEIIRQALPEWIDTQRSSHSNAYADHLFNSIAGNWQRKRPIWIMFLLNSLNRQAIERRGVPVLDLYLAQQASSLSKTLGAIETAGEQCEPLNSLRKQQVLHALNQTLYSHEQAIKRVEQSSDGGAMELARRTRDLIEHYICGSLDETIFAHDTVQVTDVDSLTGSANDESSGEINAYFKKELIKKRNVRMANRVIRLLHANPEKSFFFAFGAGHFLGKDSVIDLVKQSGFHIRPVISKNVVISRSRKPKKGRGTGQGIRKKFTSPPLWQWDSALNVPSTTTVKSTTSVGRNFQELWVRVQGNSAPPWHEQSVNPFPRAHTVQNFFLVHYHNHFSNNASGLITDSLSFLSSHKAISYDSVIEYTVVAPQKLSTFLWRIEGDPASYFFGTIHVPYTEVWEYVSKAAKQAFYQADSVFLELDLNNPKTVESLARCQYLPDGETIADHLPTDLYVRIKSHMEMIRQALPEWIDTQRAGGHNDAYADYLFKSIAGNWERKRPIWIMFLLNSLNRQAIERRGIPVLDLYLAQQASSLSIALGAIETAGEQCEPLNSLQEPQVLHALDQMLRDHEQALLVRVNRTSTATLELAQQTNRLIEHYICGSLDETIFAHDAVPVPNVDNNSRSAEDAAGTEDINAYFREELIKKRNVRMANRVIGLLHANPEKSFFFAFGAGHFLGKDSVVDLVKRFGFDVKPVIYNDTVLSQSEKVKKAPRGGQQIRTKLTSPLLWQWGGNLNLPTATTVKSPTRVGRNFQELWVRVQGYSPRPWHETAVNSFPRARTVQNFFLVHYHNHFSNNACALTTGLLLPFLSLFFLFAVQR
ncbi:Metalloprotease TIKI2 [Trichinella papuae]|uniref:Metalloprotease TIKI homolog n=1 Tax=Trichinella papuae TaxID=268474 RepID=A0A0V1MAA8_9BILA|nr:Metalloprotease TIKI2 [Trichinella papuae]